MTESSNSPQYRAPRLFVECDLRPGLTAPVTQDQARYLKTVMRRAEAAPVVAFNGRDGEWLTRVRYPGRRDAALSVDRLLRPQPPAGDGPLVVFAAVKRGPTELIVEKGAELGAARFLPVTTARANADRLNADRLRRIAVEASEQCGRMDLPAIDPVTTLAAAMSDWPPGRRLVVADETGESPPALVALQGAAPGPFGLLVGPEGGFARAELDALRRLDFVQPVGFGPRVLRAETAVIAGLALLQAVLGDLASARQAPG